MGEGRFLEFFQSILPMVVAIANGDQDVVYGSYIIGKKYEECCGSEIHEEFIIFRTFYSKVRHLSISSEWKKNTSEIILEIHKYSDLYFQDLLEVCFIVANKYS